MAEVLKRRQSSSERSMFVQVLHRGLGPHDNDDLRSLKYALAHDPVRNAWCPSLMFWHWGFHVARGRKVAFGGTTGGLVFFHDCFVGNELKVLVANPLTNKVKELPVLLHPRSDAKVRLVPAVDGGYSLVALIAHWCKTPVFVFHSRSGKWFNGAPFPNESLRGMMLGPSLNGSVYFYKGKIESFPIWRFNVKANKWSKVSVPPEVMQSVVSFKIVEHWGRLLLVAGCGLGLGKITGRQVVEQLEGIKVWEVRVVDSIIQRPSSVPARDINDAESTGRSFAETTYGWNLLGEMDQKLFKHLRQTYEDHWFLGFFMDRLTYFDLVAADHCIYLSVSRIFSARSGDNRFKHLALFDTLDRSWSWVTPPELVLPFSYCPFSKPMSFVPRKTAVP